MTISFLFLFLSIKKMKNDITKALEVLRNGGIIVYPTDTIWGIGCDATNAEAVKKIYDIKQRADTKSMIILVENINTIYSYIEEVPEIAVDIVELSDKPTTIIFPGAKNLAKNLINSDKTVGIRVVNDHFCAELIKQFKKPIVSTSANISEQKSPENFKDINPEILTEVDYVVKWKQNDHKKSKPSSIIKIGLENEIQIIRE